jgi:4'-phosphopantetheinyl transferase
VWLISLAPTAETLDWCGKVLSESEHTRARRFRFDRHRHAFILARGWLRHLLGTHAGRPPATIEFASNEFGKPSLTPSTSPAIHFNLSHSDPLALIAFTHQGETGIDIEKIRPEVMGEKIAERFFSREEVEALESVSPEHQADAFFTCWTRKEAYIKARGDGLYRSLDTFAVTLRPTEPPALCWSADDAQAPTRWKVWKLPAPAGFMASLVTPANTTTLQLVHPRHPVLN